MFFGDSFLVSCFVYSYCDLCRFVEEINRDEDGGFDIFWYGFKSLYNVVSSVIHGEVPRKRKGEGGSEGLISR